MDSRIFSFGLHMPLQTPGIDWSALNRKSHEEEQILQMHHLCTLEPLWQAQVFLLAWTSSSHKNSSPFHPWEARDHIKMFRICCHPSGMCFQNKTPTFSLENLWALIHTQNAGFVKHAAECQKRKALLLAGFWLSAWSSENPLWLSVLKVHHLKHNTMFIYLTLWLQIPARDSIKSIYYGNYCTSEHKNYLFLLDISMSIARQQCPGVQLG